MEKRDRVRVPLISRGKTAIVNSAGTGGMVYTANISPNGLCFFSKIPLPLGTDLKLELEMEHIDNDAPTEYLQGRVQWRKDWGEMNGYGISFSSPLNQEQTPQLRRRAVGFQFPVRMKRSSRRSASQSKNLLTQRERQIVHLIGQGHRNREMADQLRITRKTVETHRANIYTKLKVHNVVQLLRAIEKTGGWGNA